MSENGTAMAISSCFHCWSWCEDCCGQVHKPRGGRIAAPIWIAHQSSCHHTMGRIDSEGAVANNAYRKIVSYYRYIGADQLSGLQEFPTRRSQATNDECLLGVDL